MKYISFEIITINSKNFSLKKIIW